MGLWCRDGIVRRISGLRAEALGGPAGVIRSSTPNLRKNHSVRKARFAGRIGEFSSTGNNCVYLSIYVAICVLQFLTMPEVTVEPSPSSTALRDVYVARQSIYDAKLDVVAYEVLYRSGKENRAVFTDGNQATSELLLNAVFEIGLERVVGEKLAFVNLPREFLIGCYPLPLENQQLVLEIIEDVTIDDELVAGVSRLVS